MPALRTAFPPWPALAASAAVLLLAAAGCVTPHQDYEAFDRAVASGERPVAMAGKGTFFGGSVAATITIGRGIGSGLKISTKTQTLDAVENSMDSEDERKAQLQYDVSRLELGSPLPPITIHLKLQDQGQADLKVDVQEFNSYLGNFAVQPEVLALVPGKTIEPDPMISQLGVTSDTIPFEVTLTLAGKTETETILVKDVHPAPAQPAASKS